MSELRGKNTQGCSNSCTSRIDNIDISLPNTSVLEGNKVTEEDAHNGSHTAASNTLKDLDSNQMLATKHNIRNSRPDITLTRAAINCWIFRDRPQNRHPIPNTAYANNRQALRPKMSLSFPYRGWKDVRVRKYEVAIQLVRFRAFKSLPIWP